MLRLVLFDVGSPPLTRGKGSFGISLLLWQGITPAYAGKSFDLWHVRKLGPDHPRLRGEKLGTGRKRCKIVGSPPLTRGKVRRALWAFPAARITPAYAGKREGLDSISKRGKDHPRLRGEKQRLPNRNLYNRGSPPLTRGKGSRKAKFPIRNRITPAYAGKSFIWSAFFCST